MSTDAGQGAYVQRVLENSRRYAQELLEDNEKLRFLVSALNTEKVSLEKQLRALEEELDQHRKDRDALQERLAGIESETREFSARYVEVQQQNSNLANLYVASYRLHGTLDRREVLEIILDIVINLVGSEQIGIFELDPAGRLTLAAGFGIDPDRCAALTAPDGLIGRTVRTGESYARESEPAEPGDPSQPPLTACVPLKLEDRVIGCIAIFELLQQKPGLETADRELLGLLGTHAAMALYCATLHARAQADAKGHP